ncbi:MULTISPECIES: DEAD/DEAH box helicase [unclassified Streptococcus]|uniref:DEAD/DEAH box helicase n=1 Tax=unclassified Streptococcus TaxID=2608887 RepID=UPI0010722C5F|nr:MULTISPECIES: DEAD/DEAH box helicase [unclassified Streptococcus]MBF0787612.1 SNF2 helicase associated domain-containing protein [Streptococcus sp. 19428wC2_LYSM12]MCQ9211999.1 SNF2 family helicase [Streptococcus sp. B01]MCQ9213328.1 SNF2 family helicase [Streptococcus sp. O1]TFV05453.1 RNA helicase [Streptococcus sp. LYSM12]
MGRLMPGWIRQEGILLYERGQVAFKQLEARQLFFKIEEEDFCFSLEETKLSCSCDVFPQKGYCKHLAATEYFLKNDAEGKLLEEQLSADKEEHEETIRRTYFGGLFLDDLLEGMQEVGIQYHLAVEGQIMLFDHNIDWTLKIQRGAEPRAYIIRDIGAFLQTLKKGGYYQIGKQYYEKITFEQFDAASQDLVTFLWRLLPSKKVENLEILVHYGRHLRLPLSNVEEGLDVLKQLESFEFQYDMNTYTDLQVLPFDAHADCYFFEVVVHQYMIELRIHEQPFRELFKGRYLLVDNRLYYLDRKQEQILTMLKALIPNEAGEKTIQFDFQDQERLALSLLELQRVGNIKAPKRFIIQDFRPQFDFSLQAGGEMELRLTLDFDHRQVTSKEALNLLPFSYHFQHLAQVEKVIQKAGFQGDFIARHPRLQPAEWYGFFSQTLPTFRALGQVVLSSELEEMIVDTQPTIRVETRGSLLDISFDFTGIAEEEIEQAATALLEEATHFTSQTGKVLVFDEETRRLSQTLQSLRARYQSAGHLSLDSLSSYQLAQTWAGKDAVHFSKDFQQMVYDLAHPESFELPALQLTAELRDYQRLGVKWLSMLDHHGFGGILADDMGLGKTLQTIAFLSSHLRADAKVLILAPSSLIYNWQSECQTFAPDLDVAVAYGNKERRAEQIRAGHQIIITSYHSFRQDVEMYQQNRYDYLILDEAQVMKNAQSKIAQLLREFEVGNCFALSGTPIENQLSELWSIFQIVLPGLLPKKTKFAKLSAQEVARIIKPFVLRRKKEDVLLELPDLLEINVLNELTDEQKVVYLAQLKQMQSTIMAASEVEIQRKKMEILAGITRLRQICDTPGLFISDYKGDSGKVESLRQLLVQLKEGNHRTLIFSQFSTMLDMIEGELEALGITSYKLTGSTPANLRQTMTTAFNAGSKDCFLISLKAGGVGLNLTGADSVILVDLWWNPAVEAQAISRAHRMGQTEKVECYRLITRGTIEEKIQALQESKKHLVTTVLDGNESRASMTVEDIREILGI